MKRVGKEPRLLPNVMEAIARLKEKNGSSQKQIVEHIAQIVTAPGDKPKNVKMQVHRALEHGLRSGLIKHRRGKYCLGLDKRDYAIFKRFTRVTDPYADCNACKRRGRGRRGRRGSRRRRRSKRRGRGRRRRLSTEEENRVENTDSDVSVAGQNPEPMDKSRRRRKGRRKGRRSRRRYRRRAVGPAEVNSDTSHIDEKGYSSPMLSDKKKPDQDHLTKPEIHHSQSEKNRRDDEEDCINPDCLCNIKQEDGSRGSMGRENNYYNQNYLN